jgi:23S rRNA (cytosine1962-C5)-methyltransferase
VLNSAVLRRERLLSDPLTNMLRLFNDDADGVAGLVLEGFADVLIVQIHEGRFADNLEQELRRPIESLAHQLGVRAVYLKRFATDRSAALKDLEATHRDPTPWIGAPAAQEFDALENGIRFRIRPYDGYSVGVFLDARENRRRMRDLARGRRVLNAFAYTCGFSVAAALGGAAETVSVDVSKRYLEWGKRNFAANRVALEGNWFICSDIFDYYRRAKRQGRIFDLIVLDPPTFARVKGGKPFVLEQDLKPLVAGAIERLAPGGLLLLSTNHRGTTMARIEQAIAAGAAGRASRVVERPPLPPDFAGDREFAKSVWSEFA